MTPLYSNEKKVSEILSTLELFRFEKDKTIDIDADDVVYDNDLIVVRCNAVAEGIKSSASRLRSEGHPWSDDKRSVQPVPQQRSSASS